LYQISLPGAFIAKNLLDALLVRISSIEVPGDCPSVKRNAKVNVWELALNAPVLKPEAVDEYCRYG
jgi:hypothetical protein